MLHSRDILLYMLTPAYGATGNSFSSGGPGKGMHSRLYTRVLTQYHWAHSCTAFNSTFNGSGLVGIQVGVRGMGVRGMGVPWGSKWVSEGWACNGDRIGSTDE